MMKVAKEMELECSKLTKHGNFGPEQYCGKRANLGGICHQVGGLGAHFRHPFSLEISCPF
jgi:hypothetical protein